MNIRRQFLSGQLRQNHLTYIVHQMKMYDIDLKQCARFIFENAIFYHSAGTYYALLSKAISSMSYSITELSEKNDFIFHLLNICEEEYNLHLGNKRSYRLNEKNKKKFLKKNNEKHLITVLDKALTDLKRRANGLANFTGELFKLGLISNTKLWDYINGLMGPTANCEFCIDFVCHFLLSADGNFESIIEFQRLKLILVYFEYMLSKYEKGFPSKVWPTVHKVVELKKQWMSKNGRTSSQMKVLSAPKVIVPEIDFYNIDTEVQIYEVIKRTTEHNIDQTSEEVNNFIFTKRTSFYGIVDEIFEKGIRNSVPDNIFAHLSAKLSILTSDYLDRSFQDLLTSRLEKEFTSHVFNLFDSSNDLNRQNNIKKRLKGTVQFIGALFKVNFLCFIVVLRTLKALLDVDTISEASIECLSHFMSTIGGEGGNQLKFKQMILLLRAITKKSETKYSLQIQCSLFNLLESLKSLDTSENTSFLEQTLSVKFKKKKDSKAVLLPTNDSSTRSGEETEIMNPPQTTETAIEKLNIYIIPSILGNLKSENISLVGDQIRWTIKFIFETLIDDPNSVAVYAKMCCKLGKQIGIFNSCLMEFCQKEFECHLSQVSVYQCYDVHLQTILNTERDPIKQKEYFSMLEKSIEKQSHRSMTIVHFICELYRLCLIPEQVIEYCLITLLSPEIISEVSLKCVCCILMKFDKSLRVPVNLFDRLNQVFHVFSYELLSRYTVKIRWMIDDTVKLINFTKQMNTQQINNIPMNLKPVQQGVVLNHDQHHIPNTISKEKEDLLKKLRDLRITNDGPNIDALNAYNENGNASKKSVAANDKDESLDNLKNSQREEEAIEKNIWTSDFIQQLFQEVYTDHENGIKTTIEIAKDIKKSNSDLLITKLLDELKRNLAFVADCLKDEDVTSFLNKIELEGSFKKRKNLKNDLLDRLDAPHNALGIVKLFAELYNIGLLDYDEMIQSMNSFLDSGRINHVIIECFCEFLTRVKTKMNIEYPCQFVKYVVKLELISSNGAIQINDRIRCIVEDCIIKNI